MFSKSSNGFKTFLVAFLVCCLFQSFVRGASIQNFPCTETESRDQCRHCSCNCPTSFNVTIQKDSPLFDCIQVTCNQSSLECTWNYNESASFVLPQNAYVTVYSLSERFGSYVPSPGCCDVDLDLKRCELKNCSEMLRFGITVDGKLMGVPHNVTTIGSCEQSTTTEEPKQTRIGGFIPFEKFDMEGPGSNPTAYHFYAILLCLVGSLLLAFASVFCYFQQKRKTIVKSGRNQEFRRSKVVRKSAAPSISTSEKNSDPTRTSFLQEW